ncbi:predicted protein [Chaetoceros tenuissimus]|uniref:Uncharacterized protein n=1 Tax=Chaetoceros tenuissimus TaxID=426638 RepID=A0AAD3H5K2_9STRA|nr:predicted protein [Chaetoceros tenuissimus]
MNQPRNPPPPIQTNFNPAQGPNQVSFSQSNPLNISQLSNQSIKKSIASQRSTASSVIASITIATAGYLSNMSTSFILSSLIAGGLIALFAAAFTLPGATGTLKDFLELLVLLGLLENKASFVQENLAIDSIQAFVSVDVKELWELLMLLGMSTGRAERITEGFKTFAVFYKQHIQEYIKSDGSIAYTNTFDKSQYTEEVHHALCSKPMTNLPNISSINPQQGGSSALGSLKLSSPLSNPTVFYSTKPKVQQSSFETDSSSDEESSLTSSDEDDDDSFTMTSSKVGRYMEPKKNPMPPLGCNKSKAVAYKHCLLNEMETINAHRLVATGNRVTNPRRWKGKKNTKEQKKKYKRHKKQVKLFNEMDNALLTYIRSTAYCTGHQLSNQLAEMNSCVAAFDFIILKLSLFNYNQVFVQEEVFKNLSFKDSLGKLQRIAVHIEKESTGGCVNTTSATELGLKGIPKEIAGYKVNNFGNIPKEIFSKMTTEEKKTYFEAKQKLRDEGIEFPESSKFDDTEKKIEELESKIKELEATTIGEPVTPENGESKLKARKTGKADVMSMSYKEILEQIPDEKQRKKVVN